MRRLTGELFILAVLYLLLVPGVALSSSLRVSWNPNTESDLSGYKVYWGNTSGVYTSYVNVRNNNDVTIDGFFEGRRYYLAVTAYDYSGNESGYSQEVSISIPHTGTSILDTVFSWVANLFSGLKGLSSEITQYSLKDFSAVSPEDIEYMLNVVWIGQSYADPSIEQLALDPSGYMIRDVIAEVGIPFDFASVYDDGTYFFLPITEGASGVQDNTFSSWEPGVHLFMVTDGVGDFLHILRVSVVENLTCTGDYESGVEFFIEDPDNGITLTLSPSAIWGNVPIGIGLGFSEGNPASMLFWSNGGGFEFTVAPYGLILSEPAEIGLQFSGSSPSVEYYDENEKAWLPIRNVREEDGMVVFSTQSLGRFKVYSAMTTTADGSYGAEGGGGGGGCFISACAR